MRTVFKNWRKFFAAILGAVGEAISLGLLSGSAMKWAVVIIAAVTTVGVGAVPNDPMPAVLPPDAGAPPAK